MDIAYRRVHRGAGDLSADRTRTGRAGLPAATGCGARGRLIPDAKKFPNIAIKNPLKGVECAWRTIYTLRPRGAYYVREKEIHPYEYIHNATDHTANRGRGRAPVGNSAANV